MALYVSEVVNGCGHTTEFQHDLGCEDGRPTDHIYLTMSDRVFIRSLYWRECCHKCGVRPRSRRQVTVRVVKPKLRLPELRPHLKD